MTREEKEEQVKQLCEAAQARRAIFLREPLRLEIVLRGSRYEGITKADYEKVIGQIRYHVGIMDEEMRLVEGWRCPFCGGDPEMEGEGGLRDGPFCCSQAVAAWEEALKGDAKS